MLRRLLPLVIAMLLTGCDSHDRKVTAENKNRIFVELRDDPKISYDEKALLAALAERQRNRDALVGKTVRQLIEEERAHQAQEKAAAEERAQKELAAQAKVRAEAAAFQKALAFTVVDKRLQPKDPQAGRYEDLLVIRCRYENGSGKDIASFQGKLTFQDSYGQVLFTATVQEGKAVAAGAAGEWSGQKPFDQFSDSDAKLRDAATRGLKVEWAPRRIVFADGSALGKAE